MTSPNLPRTHITALKSYYGTDPPQTPATDKLDLNGPSFSPDEFFEKLVQEQSLSQLISKEQEMSESIRQLDSEMQTLVYENYNKFIIATETVRKMKSNISNMESSLTDLVSKMKEMTTLSRSINKKIQTHRQRMVDLTSEDDSLKKLQFLVDLPKNLRRSIDRADYQRAVRYYLQTKSALKQYDGYPAFEGIQSNCEKIIQQLRTHLKLEFSHQTTATTKDLPSYVTLLLQLDESADQLCADYLSVGGALLNKDLDDLAGQLMRSERSYEPVQEVDDGELAVDILAVDILAVDILAFVDLGCNGFVSDLCLFLANYSALFLDRMLLSGGDGTLILQAAPLQRSDGDVAENLDTVAMRKLVPFVHSLIQRYFELVQKRVDLERHETGCMLLVRALDRFHRRLQAMSNVMPGVDFSRTATEIVSSAARLRVNHYLQASLTHFNKCLMDLRQTLVTSSSSSPDLADLLKSFNQSVSEQLNSSLNCLTDFIGSEISFADKPYFRGEFCVGLVREQLVVGFFRAVFAVCREFTQNAYATTGAPPMIILLLSRFCLDVDSSLIHGTISRVQQLFPVVPDGQDVRSPGRSPWNSKTTGMDELSNESRHIGRTLLELYVRAQGAVLSQMLRRSVEARDWLNTIEPRNVRAVMKRLVEDVTLMDTQVGQLYREGGVRDRTERSSDSSRNRLSQALAAGAVAHSIRGTQATMSNSISDTIMSNIQKIFAERIEIYGQVEFNRVSVLTGIIKIALKTLLECVRMRTLSRYGLQQVQVDACYLQSYLWRFVADENLVFLLLEGVVNSAVHRCFDPVLMESSVVDLICERT